MQTVKESIGIRTANPADRVALRGVHLQARLSGMSLRATLDQTFVNLEPRAIEAIYTFPLPEGAAVCGFEVITGERVLTGTIEEINQGIEQYEQAVSEGHGAFLMEQERPDVFTVRVGNLKPRQAATIRLSYVCPLERVDKSIRVAFPTTIAPRYTTATGTDPIEAAIDGDALNPPHVLSVPYGLSIEVDVALGRKLSRVGSPSHAISIANGEDATCRITFAGGIAEMDRDVVLLLDLSQEHQPCVQASIGSESESYLAVTFVPEFEDNALAEHKASETIFVLDCSGSMQGESIEQANAALELCLRSMSLGDTFNICKFGSGFELMSSEPLVYTQTTLDKALAYVRTVRDLGGTELHAPLEAILSKRPAPGMVRQLILLTDGQVSNEPAVVDLARKYRRYNRIFSFGIGAASSSFLVKGIARATGGAPEFITAGERIDDKVLRTFGRITSPPVTDITIDWDGCDVQTLAELPPVFDGDVMAVFGRAPTRLPRRVTLSCDTPAGPKSWSVDVPTPVQDGGVIATMWARRTIQSMEEVNSLAGTRSRIAEPGREREMLIQLSKQFGLLCSLTTFIAVEHRSPMERNNGEPAQRKVPVKLAAGWGGVQAPAMAVGGGMAYACMPAPASATRGAPVAGRAFGLASRLFKKALPPAPAQRKTTDAPRTMDQTLDKTFDRSLDRSIDKSISDIDLGSFETADPIERPVAKLLYAVLVEALKANATHIEFVPFDDRMEVQFRTVSAVSVRDRIPNKMKKVIIRQLKRVAKMNPDADATQSSISLEIDGNSVEFLASTLLTSDGPSFTLHVIKVGPAHISLDEEVKGILALQSAEGWFGSDRSAGATDALDDSIVRIGASLSDWNKAAHEALPALHGGSVEPDRAARTGIALVVLMSRAKTFEPVWKRAHLKAVRHLSVALGIGLPEVEAWLESLRRKLGM